MGTKVGPMEFGKANMTKSGWQSGPTIGETAGLCFVRGERVAMEPPGKVQVAPPSHNS